MGIAVGAAVGDGVGDTVGVGELHFFSEEHKLLAQSVPASQPIPGAHGRQLPPPQSMSVSLPPFIPSLQVESVGNAVGASLGACVGA